MRLSSNLSSLGKIIWVGIGLVISLYLLLPGPKLPPPDLPGSFKSDEPGDTYQISNVSAYYTNKSRKDVINFYTQYFFRSKILNIPLPGYRFNHPPEYARKVWIDTKKSFYLEELIHPFRESLFVNGLQWRGDIKSPPEKRKPSRFLVGGRVWPTKVSLRWFYSAWWARLPIFWASWIVFYFLLKLWRVEIENLWKKEHA
jgi:hypothetical protein